jgi:hypothetical protein
MKQQHRYLLQQLDERGIPQTVDGFASRHLAKAVAAKSRTTFVRNARTGRVWSHTYNRWVPLEFYCSIEGFLGQLAPTPLWDHALNRFGRDLGYPLPGGVCA